MVDRLVAVDDADYRLPEPVLAALGADVGDTGSTLGAQLSATFAVAVSVAAYGAVGDGVTDDTAAIRAAGAVIQAAGGGTLHMPPSTYKVTIPEGGTLLSFSGCSGIVIDAPGATIIDPTSYVADSISAIFKFDGCKSVAVTLGDYIGYTLPEPATHLGYRGATVVYAVGGTSGVSVRARLTNARYGVLTGGYADPALGGCTGFDIRLQTSFVGYPVAAYLASGMQVDIDADDSHRAAYFAGCQDVRGVARWRNIYIAPIAVLLTDALTAGSDSAAQADPTGSPTSSRGCSDVDFLSVDKGSTVFQAETYAIGIALSRCDPMTYKNLNLGFGVTATDVLSTTVQAFIITSSAIDYWSRYAHRWEPHVNLDDVGFYGTLDKSAVTVSAGAQGPFTIRAQDTDATHAGTVRGLELADIVLKRGPAGLAAALILARGLATPLRVRGVSAPVDDWWSIDTSATVPTIFESSSIGTIDNSRLPGGSRIVVGPGASLRGISGTSPVTESAGGVAGGAGPIVKTKELSVTLAGASVTVANAIPTGCILLGAQGRIKTAITGATGYQVGVSGDLTRFANRNDTAVGSVFGPSASTDATVRYYQANTGVIVTAKGADFTGGVLRLVLTYFEFNALT